MSRVLVALGGNAMTGPGGEATQAAQRAAIEAAMRHVAELVAHGDEVVLSHGNGPQVGNLLVKNELAAHVVPPVSLDWCIAQTQATIGATVLNGLDAALAARRLRRRVAVVVTRTRVDPTDPGLQTPSKPVGRYVGRAEAERMIAHGQVWEDFGACGWRRVVPSPRPVEILDAPAVEALLAAGYIVVAGGGGGVPVVADGRGGYAGVDAVIDKDLTAALLARHVGAQVLCVATAVENAYLHFGTPRQRALGRVEPAELAAHAAAGAFAKGSMGPKVEAVLAFAAGGGRGVITSLERIVDGVAGRVGTVVEVAGPAGRPQQ